MDAQTGRSTSPQRPESQDSPVPASPPDLASLASQNVMATIRRRRVAVEQGNHPQARIYKKARMRTRNWSELRQRPGEQANPPPEAPNLNAENVNHQVVQLPAAPNHQDVQPPEPATQDISTEVNRPPQPPESTTNLRNTPLPRDHLLLLVPPEPRLPNI